MKLHIQCEKTNKTCEEPKCVMVVSNFTYVELKYASVESDVFYDTYESYKLHFVNWNLLLL